MSTELVPYKPRPLAERANSGMSLNDFAEAAFAAKTFRSKITSKADAIVIMVAGQAMGVGWYTALSEIDIIEGSPTPNANLSRTLVMNAPDWDMQIIEMTNTQCVIDWWTIGKRSGKWEVVGRTTWTMEDAKQANLLKGVNWQKYPRNMLLARATTEGFRTYCPHLAGGCSMTSLEEKGAETDEAGKVIALPAKVVEVRPSPAILPPKTLASDPDGLLTEIQGWVAALGVDVARVYRNYKVSALEELTVSQGEQLAKILRGQHDAKVAKAKHDAEREHTIVIPDAEIVNV